MTNLWNEVRTIINNYGKSKGLLLSLIDKEGNLYSINAEMRRVMDLFNTGKNKINLFDHVQAEHVNGFKNSIRISGETMNFYPARLNVKNGHYHPLRLQVHPLPFSGPQKQLFLCIGNEMFGQSFLQEGKKITTPENILKTEPKAGPLLNDTEGLFHSAMKGSPALTWMVDEDEKLVFANIAFKKYFNLPEAAIQEDIKTYIPKKVIDSLYKKHVDALTAGNPVLSTEKIYLADGSDIAFHVSLFSVDTRGGKKIITGQAYILPAKNALEKQLKEANEQLILLSKATSDAIWEWDMRTGNIFRNDPLMKMIGFQPNEKSGLAWWFRRIHPQDRNRVSDKIKEVTDNGLLSWQDDYRFRCADNDYKEIHDHGYVVYENGLPVKMIGSLRDVSEVKELQNQLHKEKMDRQKELSEIIMKVQEKERTRIGYELHDNINQILSTSKLFVDMLAVTKPEQKKLKTKSLEYLLLAIEEVRKLSKGLVVPQLKEKGLVDSIRTMADDIQVSNALKIKFTHDNETDLLSSGKKLTLFRIVQEQLKNILTHSQAKEADIYLQCRNDTVMLIIKDDGIGFDPKQTRRGIGLSNIFERTRFYNGVATIETTPGRGCMLKIFMPAN